MGLPFAARRTEWLSVIRSELLLGNEISSLATLCSPTHEFKSHYDVGHAAARQRCARRCGRRNQAPRPNVLFLLSDDHRPDGIGALGNPHLKTPALDTLVARGMTFRHAYTMGAMEGAVCLPSRSMIQTGRSLFRLPPVNFRKSYEEFAVAMTEKAEGRDWALLPRVLRTAGYETFHMGKRGNECLPAMENYETNILRDDPTPAERVNSSQAYWRRRHQVSPGAPDRAAVFHLSRSAGAA